MLNGFEMAVRNNAAGDMSAAYFIGTSEDCGDKIEAVVTVAPSTWDNSSTTETITIDATANKALLARLQVGDKIVDSNGDALYGIGTYVSHTAAGVITFNVAQLTASGTAQVEPVPVAGAKNVGTDTGPTGALKVGQALYSGAAATAVNTPAKLAAEFLGISTQTGIQAIGATAIKFDEPLKTLPAANDLIYASSGTHFTTVPVVGSKISFKLGKGECPVENNITGFRLKFKLGRFGSMGYEDIELKT
jgi:hypothetical protein